MFDPAQIIAFTLACFIIVIVPGPTVTVIIANSIRHGVRAGLINVAGTQAGLAVMIIVLATGLDLILQHLSVLFDWIRWIGAAYLIWLGIKLLRTKTTPVDDKPPQSRDSSYFWQGFLIIWSNPKALLFFGAFIPQFVNVDYQVGVQTVVLGGIFMIVATLFDSLYAFVAGNAGKWLIRSRMRIVESLSVLCLIAGGIWLMLLKRS